LAADVLNENPNPLDNSSNKKFPALTISAQNCLSLNISTKSNKTDLKILAVTKSANDIVLLSDIRLNSTKQSASLHDLEKKFRLKGYNFIHNSKSSSRGVGILLKNTLLYTIHSTVQDYDDNYVLLDISIDNYRLILGSVYGPNRDDLEFFDNLKLDIRNLNQKSIILGGDWNATLDSNPVPVNIDVINMVSIPSKRRSQKIAAIASSLNLVDPYRFFNPEKRDFTFIPNTYT
jgi:exonuclease III